jgi:hypothetical protein
VRIRDGDRGVVERSADVGDSFRLDDALYLLSDSHSYFVTFFLPAIARRGPFFVRALV